MRNLQMILLSLMMVMAVCICLLCNASAYQVERASEADKPTVMEAEQAEMEETTEAEEPAESPEPDEEPPIEEQVRVNRECGALAYDIPAKQCPGHEWDYDYDHDTDGNVTYGRYCVNCGKTEDLDACPPQLEWTLPDDGEGQEEPEEIPDEEVTNGEESKLETNPADESGDSSAEMEG